ncbi:BBE domain-containing protein [Bradyrhizobium sp. CCBAU 51745]|uniref:BBE domain-containing protein n=1 Tax=unclassified Bradyrhizobium TaxID=2631580 RepID=UPI003FA45B09
MDSIRRSIEPLSIRGAYPAILDVDSHDQAREFYGDALKKLRRLKTHYDPSNRFSSEFGIL